MIKKGGGSIICTASVAGIDFFFEKFESLKNFFLIFYKGLRSGAGPADYSCSKAAVISLCQTAANQLSGTNVRVNAICPVFFFIIFSFLFFLFLFSFKIFLKKNK